MKEIKEVILYTSHCPVCLMIENILKNKKIEYTVEDKEDIYMPLAEENHIRSMPFAKINGEIMNIKQIQELLKEDN